MLKIRKLSDVIGLRVFTDTGDFFGEVEEANLVNNKIDGWRIRVGGGMSSLVGGARGVVIPHQFVKAIGDVFIVTRGNLPAGRDEMPSASDSMPGSSSGSQSGAGNLPSGSSLF